MRLFIAIELPRSFKQELARVQKEVKQMSCGGRFVPQENFHVTLHFIGESNDLAGAVAAMREAVRGIRTFTLHLGKYDCFDKNGSKTSFLAVKGELDELERLYESLQCALYDNGFSRRAQALPPAHHAWAQRGARRACDGRAAAAFPKCLHDRAGHHAL